MVKAKRACFLSAQKRERAVWAELHGGDDSHAASRRG